MMPRLRALLAASAVIVTLAWGGRARASPEYPDVIQSYLQLPSARPCTLCHAAGEDAGKADTPFATSAVARGLLTADDGSLRSALDTMRSDRVDSDGDTMSDTDELAWGTDPNVPDRPQGDVAPAMTYGCSAARARTPASAPCLGVLALLAAWMVRRVRMRSMRRCPAALID